MRLVYNHSMPTKQTSSQNNLRAGLVLFCMVLLMAGYYLVHKPVTPDIATAGASGLWRVFVAIAILVLAGTIGRAAGIPFNADRLSGLVLQAGLGLGIISVYILVGGSLLGLNWITLGVIPAIILVIFRNSMIGWLISLCRAAKQVWAETRAFEKTIAIIIAVIFFFSLMSALAPPLKYDALMYHLVMPQTYIQQGQITHIPWLVMTGMPQATEMIFTLAIWYGGLPAAAVTGWLIGLLAILGLIGFFHDGSENFRRAGWVAAASLLAGETFASSLSWAYIDWMGLFFGVCCIIPLRGWYNSGRLKQLFCAGIFAGLAFTTKYTGGILFLCVFTSIVWYLIKNGKEENRPVLNSVLLFSAGAAIFPLIWLTRNAITTGNPLFPFFFPAAEMNAIRLSVYQGAEPYGEWWEGFLLPFRASLWGQESAEGYSVSIGPLLLILGIAGLLRKQSLEKADKHAEQIGLMFFLSAWLFWAVGNRMSGYLIQTRMYFSLFPAFAVLAGLGWEAVREIRWHGARFSRLFGLVIILSLSLSSVNLVIQTLRQDSLKMIAGMIGEDAYLDANLGWYAPAVRAVNRLPEGSRVLFFYEPRGLACTPRCDPDEILDHWKITWTKNVEPDSVLPFWRGQGYNYLFINNAGMEFLSDGNDPHHPAEEIAALKDVLDEIPLLESFGQSYQIYQVP